VRATCATVAGWSWPAPPRLPDRHAARGPQVAATNGRAAGRLRLLVGLALALVLATYASMPPQALWQAGGATALFVAGFRAAGYATRRDLTAIVRAGFWALLALIVFGIVLIFVNIPGGALIHSVLGLVILAGFIMFDFRSRRHSAGVADRMPLDVGKLVRQLGSSPPFALLDVTRVHLAAAEQAHDPGPPRGGPARGAPEPAEPCGEPDQQPTVQPAGDQPLLELILHREEPVIGLRVVPAERVRLVKQVVSEQRTVTEELRKEQVDLRSEPPDQPADPESQQRR
jgi:hypothetical protein